MDNLRFIRETMERATSFTAVSGWGTVAVGVTALIAAALAPAPGSQSWLAIWMGEALISIAIAALTMIRKARVVNLPLLSGAGRKFGFSFFPPVMAGAILTLVLVNAGLEPVLPGLWLLLYGVGVVTAGTFSVRVVPIMGVCFMGLGAIALFVPFSMANIFMAAGFGLLHVVFGLIIGWRHGG